MTSIFRPDDFTVVDLYGYIRSEQARFFNGGAYDANELASQIALEALLLGASEIGIVRESDWITVSADIDWLADVGGDPFSELVPIPQAGRNAVTAEVLPVVFSCGVVTATGAGVVLVKGDSLGPLADWRSERGRVVAFHIVGE